MSLYHNIPAPTLGRQDPNKSTGALIFSVPFCPPRCDYFLSIWDFGKIDTWCVSLVLGFKIEKAVVIGSKIW